MKKATIRTEDGVGWLEAKEKVYLGEISDKYIKKLKSDLQKQGYKVSLIHL